MLVPPKLFFACIAFAIVPCLSFQGHRVPKSAVNRPVVSRAFPSQARPFLRSEPTNTLKASGLEVDPVEEKNTMPEVPDATKKSFEGKSVLLTGASGGLGHALALQLARCCVSELILSGRNEDTLRNVAMECQAISPNSKFHIVSCDLSDRDSVRALGQKALALCDTIDVLINNGGVSSRSNFVDTSLEVDERVMQINFFAGAALAKIVVPNMVTNQSGKIIWISSVQGLLGIPSRTSYAASKFAVQGYCEGLRAELASSGVTVHVASPGYIRTNLSMSALTGDGKTHGEMDENTAKGADPNDVAATVLNNVARGCNEFVVAAGASAKAAIWLRLLFPSLLQELLVSRFKKSQKQKED